MSLETLQISYSKRLVEVSAMIGPTGHGKNMLVIFVNFTSTFIMTIIKIRGCARKLKCFQTNIAPKIKLLIIRKIGSLTVLQNLSKKTTINKLK